MTFKFLNLSTWNCCCSLICNKKCLSLLGAATFLLFPFGYYIYRFFSNSEFPKSSKESNIAEFDKDLIMKKSLISSFPIIYNSDHSINVLTMKKIYYLTIIFCQEELTIVRRKILLLRRKFFYNIEKYIEITLFLYNEYYNILENALKTILLMRDIDRKSFENSIIRNEREGLLRKGFLRDAAYSILSEKIGNSHKINREKMKEYILMQIKDLKVQKRMLHKELASKDKNIRIVILSSRADDLAFDRLDIDELDYIKSLKFYINDDEIKGLIEKRNTILNE